jgi:hypothetical protein
LQYWLLLLPDAVNVIHVPSPSWYILFNGFAVNNGKSSAMNVITPPKEQVVPVNNLFAILFFIYKYLIIPNILDLLFGI